MNKTFLTVVSLIMTVCFVLCFAACGGKTNVEKDHDVVELARSIYTNCTFDDTGLAEVPNPEFTVCTVFGADPALIAGEEGAKKAVAYVSSASPEMIICIEAVDAASAQKLMNDTFKPLVDNYIHEYTNYTPAEVSKLETAVETVSGRYMVLVVSADNSGAQNHVDTLLG